MRTLLILFYLGTLAMWGQVNSGELRLRVVDGSGLG